MQQDLGDKADAAVLLLSGGESAGPGLPISISPPGTHHRVGTHILLLVMVSWCPFLPGWEILLPASCTQLVLVAAPSSSSQPRISLLSVVQGQSGPCSQMLMVVNVEWGNSRLLQQAVEAGVVARFEF